MALGGAFRFPSTASYPGCRTQLAEGGRELRHLMIGIEATRLRQQPQPGWPKPLWLRSDHRPRPPESRAIRTYPHHRHPVRPMTLYFPLEPRAVVGPQPERLGPTRL